MYSINYIYTRFIENSSFLLKNFIGLNDNQHNIIISIIANSILDDIKILIKLQILSFL